MNATFSTHPIMIYVVKITNYESHSYVVSALLSLPIMSKGSALHHTLHLTNLQTLFTVYVFCM